ncbi:hypothetical protein SH661x_000022 [Planctomicrobium sp. SH661]|uniref:hypothetical protein n=1 Tax=Planctomicrobium sp. SH661 TaxID=3448124 RepID=UPI003F5BD589
MMHQEPLAMMNCHVPHQLRLYSHPQSTRHSSKAFSDCDSLELTRSVEADFLPASSLSYHMMPDCVEDQSDLLEQLIGDFIQSVPPAKSVEHEAERFVGWIEEHEQIDPEQRDLVLCLYAHRAVETAALQKRLAHARFTELLKKSQTQIPTLTRRSKVTLRLNPVHVWATFQTRVLLNPESEVPACALFYQVGREVQTAVLNGHLLELVQMLEEGSLKVSSLFAHLHPHLADDVWKALLRLIELKIVAFE